MDSHTRTQKLHACMRTHYTHTLKQSLTCILTQSLTCTDTQSPHSLTCTYTHTVTTLTVTHMHKYTHTLTPQKLPTSPNTVMEGMRGSLWASRRSLAPLRLTFCTQPLKLYLTLIPSCMKCSTPPMLICKQQSVSHWISTSCQPHRVTSGQSNSIISHWSCQHSSKQWTQKQHGSTKNR